MTSDSAMKYTEYINWAYKNHINHLMISAEFNLHISFLVKVTSTDYSNHVK